MPTFAEINTKFNIAPPTVGRGLPPRQSNIGVNKSWKRDKNNESYKGSNRGSQMNVKEKRIISA
jgi:hypothetical protein